MADFTDIDSKLIKKWKKLKKSWAPKIGANSKTLDKQVLEILVEEEKTHDQWTKDKQFTNSMRRLYIRYKKQLSSPAVVFDYFAIGVGDLIDTVAKRRREAFSMYQNDNVGTLFSESNPNGVVIVLYKDDYIASEKLKEYKDLTILGLIERAPRDNPDEQEAKGDMEYCVVPVDNRKVFRSGKDNRGYGKPLPKKSYMRNIFGIGMHSGSKKPKFMQITVNDALAEKIPSVWTALRSRFNWRPSDEEKANPDLIVKYRLNGSSATKFEPASIDNQPDFEMVIKKFADDFFVQIEELDNWHDENEDDQGRVVITEGDVTQLMLEPTAQGSRRIVIDDMALGFGGEDELQTGVTCWVSAHIPIDFGEESRVIVIGKTNRGRSKDEVTGEWTDEYGGDVNMGLYGIYAIPEFKVEIEAEPVSEEEVFGTQETKEKESHSW